ncbi:hypothetical protein BC826DRAFT_321175 [Russula brevipes]|nr:hypothetical protein BC826DRAFT_321175 [Russula brevipes]
MASISVETLLLYAFIFSTLQALTPPQLIPIDISLTDQRPYCEVSGTCHDCDKTDSTFRISTSQYTSFVPIIGSHTASPLTFVAHFDDKHYKSKKPMPSNDTIVTVRGFLTGYNDHLPSDKRPTTFDLDVNNIVFLGKNARLPPPSGTCSIPAVHFHFNPTTPATSKSPSTGKFQHKYETKTQRAHESSATILPATDEERGQKHARIE